MPLRQLKSIYEKRQQTLKTMLTDRKLTAQRRGQVEGALGEIESFMKTIDTLREQEIEDNRKLDSKTSIDISKGMFSSIHKHLNSRFDMSKTRKNLELLFLKKSETAVRYDLYSRLAKEEGYESIAHVFKEFSEHEREHSKLIFNHLGLNLRTKNNVLEAAEIERQYHAKMYDEFEDTAKKERFNEIAEFIKELSSIEAEHEKKFLRMLKVMHENRMFVSESIVRWKCRNCGHVIDAKEAPKKCKVCKRSQAFFEIHSE